MQNPENPYEIDRLSPDVKVQIGREVLHLTCDNTDIYQFGRGYGMFDHIHVRTPIEVELDSGEEAEIEESNYIFNCDDLIKALIAHDFPRHYFPYPPEDIVEFYMTISSSIFAIELVM